MLNRVAIYFKDNNSKTRNCVERLVEELQSRGIKNRIYEKIQNPAAAQDWKVHEDSSGPSDSLEVPDLVLSVGGDGTFLETVMKIKDMGIPVAGVNTGRMGFLANISADEIKQSIDMLSTGEYKIVDRCLLEISRPAGFFTGSAAFALNENTIQKADMSMITISVFVDEVHLNTYWADGLIVSTATGSTAYNLSVGGPILSPEDESIIISPIAPHNLTVRPIILSGEGSLRMVIEGRTKEFLTTCDFRSRRLPFSEEVHIVKAQVRIKTVMLKGRDFYSTLRNKLMWGADRRN